MQRVLWILPCPPCSEVNEAMQELTGKQYVSSKQHKNCSKIQKDRAYKNAQSLVQYLEDRNPFSDELDLHSITSGVLADKKVNVDEPRNVGQNVINRLVD